VRWDAVKKIGDCVPRGEKDSIAAILQKFNCEDPDVRKVVVTALSKVVVEDDTEGIKMIVAMLEHAEDNVRCTAVKALSTIIKKGNIAAIEAVSHCLEHCRVEVRLASARVLVAIASTGRCFHIIPAVANRLGHESECVRVAAGRCLARLAPRGHRVAITSVSKFLQSEIACVRRTAVKALGGLVDKSNRSDIELIMSCFSDWDSNVRKAAVSAMKAVVESANVNLLSTASGVKWKGQTRPTLIIKDRFAPISLGSWNPDHLDAVDEEGEETHDEDYVTEEATMDIMRDDDASDMESMDAKLYMKVLMDIADTDEQLAKLGVVEDDEEDVPDTETKGGDDGSDDNTVGF
jgi:HEAT repeat protein